MPAYKGEHEDVLRPFFDAMRHKLASSKHAGKKRWEELTTDGLLGLLKAEIAELEEAIAGRNQIEILLEAADVGNYAMMVATVAIRSMSRGDSNMTDAMRQHQANMAGGDPFAQEMDEYMRTGRSPTGLVCPVHGQIPLDQIGGGSQAGWFCGVLSRGEGGRAVPCNERLERRVKTNG